MMRCVLIAVVAMALQACARSEPQPSYLGAALFGDEPEQAATVDRQPVAHPDLRHIESNKVLGAMAFQKATGQTVDPSRLSSRP